MFFKANEYVFVDSFYTCFVVFVFSSNQWTLKWWNCAYIHWKIMAYKARTVTCTYAYTGLFNRTSFISKILFFILFFRHHWASYWSGFSFSFLFAIIRFGFHSFVVLIFGCLLILKILEDAVRLVSGVGFVILLCVLILLVVNGIYNVCFIKIFMVTTSKPSRTDQTQHTVQLNTKTSTWLYIYTFIHEFILIWNRKQSYCE